MEHKFPSNGKYNIQIHFVSSILFPAPFHFSTMKTTHEINTIIFPISSISTLNRQWCHVVHGNHHGDTTTCCVEKQVLFLLKLECSVRANGVLDKELLTQFTIGACHHHDVDTKKSRLFPKRTQGIAWTQQ